jgi:hypothetical protein
MLLYIYIYIWANPSLGGTTNNHLKEWLWNQSWPNHFPSPFPLNVFTTIIGFFFHACLKIWLEIHFGLKK